MKKNKSFFLFAGGSAGHIKPALILKKKLEKRNSEVFLFLSSFRPIIKSKNIKILNISRNKLRAVLQTPFIFLYLLSIAFLKRGKLFLGFGGYYSIPGILVAKVLRVPVLIYEPNVVIGRANRVLRKISDYILTIWPQIKIPISETGKVLRIKPLIREVREINRSFDKPDKFSILVVGGSQGSLFLNELLINLIQNYNFQNENIRLTLITGETFYSKVKDKIVKSENFNRLNIQVLSYVDNIESLYQKSDLLISRAGAQTLLESVFYNLAGIFIPYPYAYQHQLENAKLLYYKGASILVEQSVLNWKFLGDLLLWLKHNPVFLDQIRTKLSLVKQDLLSAQDADSIILRI